MAHQDLPTYAHPDAWLDADHAVEYTTRQGESEPCGGILWHRVPECDRSATPGWCVGGFQWRGPHVPHWQLVSLNPLHVEPSIKCSCGAHGFIRGERWIPA